MVASAVQVSFDEMGTPLHLVDFVVVDLETTGGAPADAGITEIGAVRIRGGEVLGEFQTMVNPGHPIPAFIAALTGITDHLVATAPDVPAAVSSFLEFSRGAVLVAHNAPYDMGFLKGACGKHGLAWPSPTVVDTARISRAAMHRDEVPNHRLATLAAHVRSQTKPTHRALDDARATVDVLHFLIGRVGSLGVQTLEELAAFGARVTREQRAKRTLADDLPVGPGVYIFRDHAGRPLYVGTSRRIRQRVRTYFTASEKRTRMAEMIRVADRVDAIECATPLEAEIRETRLIVEHRPPYNRRSRFPERSRWIRFTQEPYPRLSISGRVPTDVDGPALGPFGTHAQAEAALTALSAAFDLRTCTMRLPRNPAMTACTAGQLGLCSAPCDGSLDLPGYRETVDRAVAAVEGDFRAASARLHDRMRHCSDQGDYEAATQWRQRLAALAHGVRLSEEFGALSGMAELVAAQPDDSGGWYVHIIRHGRLAGAARCRPSDHPGSVVAAARATAEIVAPPGGPVPPAYPDEVRCLLRWLATPGVRLVRCEGTWARRMHGATSTWTRLNDVAKEATKALRAADNSASGPRAPGRSRANGPAPRPRSRL